MQFLTAACLFLVSIKTFALQSQATAEVRFSCDDRGWLFINGKHVKDVHGPKKVAVWRGNLKVGDTVMIKGKDDGGHGGGYGCSALVTYRDARGVIRHRPTNTRFWHALPLDPVWARKLPHFLKKNPISKWPAASAGKSTATSKVAPRSRLIWAQKPHGLALIATTLGSGPVATGSVRFSCDDRGWLFINGKHVKDVHGQKKVAVWRGHLKVGDTVMIKGKNTGGRGYGCSALIGYRNAKNVMRYRPTNTRFWRALPLDPAWARKLPHFLRKNPISRWPAASKGTAGTKVHRRSQLIWAHKPSGLALMATKLGSGPVATGSVRFSCDNHGWLFINGKHVKDHHDWRKVGVWTGHLKAGDTVMIKGKDDGGGYGCSALVTYRDANGVVQYSATNSKHWRALPLDPAWAAKLPHFLKKNPLSRWPAASKGTWGTKVHPHAKLIWGSKPHGLALMATKLGSGPVITGLVRFSCDDHGWLFINGKHVKDVHGWMNVAVWTGHLKAGDTVMIKGKDIGGGYGCSALVTYRDAKGVVRYSATNSKYWRALPLDPAWAAKLPHFLKKNPISKWPAASKGTWATKVHPQSSLIWAHKPHGLALMATELGW